jgi:integrase/recombinase XerD
MTPLRQRMYEDMRLRNFTPSTQKVYVDNVARFARHFHASPDRLGYEHIRSFLLLLIERRLSWTYFNQVLCSLRFFYTVTLAREWPVLNLVCAKVPQKLPQVLGRHEVADFLGCINNLKHRALLSTLYATGPRSLELLQLQIADVDSQRMVLMLRGKGQKERLVPLSPQLLSLLRDYWRAYQPRPFLFPGPDANKPLTYESLSRLCHQYGQKARLLKHVTAHGLRHTFATHLYENGVALPILQMLLGHRHLRTTLRYVRLAVPAVCADHSPCNLLAALVPPPPAAATTTAMPCLQQGGQP